MFLKELKLFNHGFLILAANKRAFYCFYKLSLARLLLSCYCCIYVIIIYNYFFAMELTQKLKKKFQYKKNK